LKALIELSGDKPAGFAHRVELIVNTDFLLNFQGQPTKHVSSKAQITVTC